MKNLLLIVFALTLAGCGLLPTNSPTKLEKSPCACGEDAKRHV